MYLLDTDSTSNYLDKRRNCVQLRARIEAEPPQNICISIITVEEILRGVLTMLKQARDHPRNAKKIIEHYKTLNKLATDLMELTVLLYDAEAEAMLSKIPSSVRQRHSQDCHIAAIAASNECIVVTSNSRDFEKINIVQHVDWMKEDVANEN